MIREIFPLLKFEIIAVFVNTWAADYKYPVMDCKYLKNQKYFLRFFFPFLESTSNFKHLQEKDGPQS